MSTSILPDVGSTGTYYGVPTVVFLTDVADNAVFLEFIGKQQFIALPGKNYIKGTNFFPDASGRLPDPNKYYCWIFLPDMNLTIHAANNTSKAKKPIKSKNAGMNCEVCNAYNEYAEPNLAEKPAEVDPENSEIMLPLICTKYICFSCKASYAWKYEGRLA